MKYYNLTLKEREKRKKFIVDKSLLDLKRQNRIESKLPKDNFELFQLLKTFARFYDNLNLNFSIFFEGFAI